MTKRTTYTVQPSSGAVRRCARCTMPLRAGQRATVIREHGLVIFRHAGKVCPSLRPPAPFPTRYVN